MGPPVQCRGGSNVAPSRTPRRRGHGSRKATSSERSADSTATRACLPGDLHRRNKRRRPPQTPRRRRIAGGMWPPALRVVRCAPNGPRRPTSRAAPPRRAQMTVVCSGRHSWQREERKKRRREGARGAGQITFSSPNRRRRCRPRCLASESCGWGRPTSRPARPWAWRR